MKRRKVCVVVTARPSYSRVKTALEAIQAHPDLDLQLVVAASALLAANELWNLALMSLFKAHSHRGLFAMYARTMPGAPAPSA